MCAAEPKRHNWHNKKQLVYYRPDLQVLYCLCEKNLNWNHKRSLSAPYWRFYWNIHGTSKVFLHGKQYTLSSRNFLLIPPNTPFTTSSERLINHFYVHFLVKPPLDQITNRVFTVEKSLPVIQKIRTILSCFRKGEYNSIKVSLLSHSICSDVILAVPDSCVDAIPADPRIQDVISYMKQNLDQKLQNRNFAKIAGMNANAFVRLFKEHQELTPLEYLKKLRIDQACVMLQFTDASIESIAEATGFCDRYHFTRDFCKIRAIGPAAYRNTIT